MTVWIEPIFDRTEEDVEFAKEQISRWIAEELSGSPIETYDLKGCLNVVDLNRIEGNINYLNETLAKLHYPPGTSSKVWERRDLPTERDVSRILNNIRLIISVYYQQQKAPDVPESMRTYKDINAIEENLLLIKQLIDSMRAGFQKSAAFQSGAMRILPIRR